MNMPLYSLNKNPVIERKSCQRKMQIRIQNSCFWPILHHTSHRYHSLHCVFFPIGMMQCQALVDYQEYLPSKQVAD